jgi:hypothetical protein
MKQNEFSKKFFSLRKKLGKIGFICTGSVMSISQKCGNPDCACARDPGALHGPYNRWTRKVALKTVTRGLTETQAQLCRECIQNYRKLEEILEEMKTQSVLYIESQR